MTRHGPGLALRRRALAVARLGSLMNYLARAGPGLGVIGPGWAWTLMSGPCRALAAPIASTGDAMLIYNSGLAVWMFCPYSLLQPRFQLMRKGTTLEKCRRNLFVFAA